MKLRNEKQNLCSCCSIFIFVCKWFGDHWSSLSLCYLQNLSCFQQVNIWHVTEDSTIAICVDFQLVLACFEILWRKQLWTFTIYISLCITCHTTILIRSLLLYVCFVDRCFSFCTFSFVPLCCLFFFDLRILITPLVFSNSS